MRRLRIVLPLLVLLLLVPSAPQSEMRKSFNFFLGGKLVPDLSEDLPLDLSRQVDLGVEMSFGPTEWPVMIAVDILGSVESDSTVFDYTPYIIDFEQRVTTLEVNPGVRKTWGSDTGRTHPYLGGGISMIRGRVETTVSFRRVDSASVNDSEMGFGIWLGGGIYWKLGDRLNLGLNLRYSRANVGLDNFHGDAVDLGGFHAGLLLGWGF